MEGASMKYIRTKDNRIYKLSNGVDFKKTKETYVWCFDKRFGFNFKVDTKNILEQADTIEELCDYVVSMNELCDVPIVEELPHEMGNDRHFISNVKFQTLQGQHGEWWVKLAIATDEGLIYVAKMNDKGELELL